MNGCEIIDLLNRYGVLMMATMIRSPRQQYIDAAVNYSMKPILICMHEPHADPIRDIRHFHQSLRIMDKIELELVKLNCSDKAYPGDEECDDERYMINQHGRNVGRRYAIMLAGMPSSSMKSFAERAQIEFENKKYVAPIIFDDYVKVTEVADNRPWYVTAANKGGYKNKKNHKR